MRRPINAMLGALEQRRGWIGTHELAVKAEVDVHSAERLLNMLKRSDLVEYRKAPPPRHRPSECNLEWRIRK